MSSFPESTPPLPLKTDDLEVLLESSRALSGTLDLPDLLKTVMGLAARVVRAEAGSVLLADERTGELVFDTALGEAESRLKAVRLKPGEGLAGWVAAHDQGLVVNDVAADPRWATRVDRGSDFTTRQVVAVPLRSKGRVIGVVEGINRRDGERFGPADLRALEIFASQVAVAVENARLFQRLLAEKETLDTLFGHMSDGALLTDEEGKVAMINPSGARLLGVDPGEAAGRAVSDITREFEARPPWRQVLRAAVPSAMDLMRSGAKTLVLEVRVDPVKEGVGRLLLFRDVTESRREERIKRNFLSLISHKLKTPLVAITGYAPLLLQDRTLNDPQRRAVAAIRDQGQKLSQLVDRLLSFTTIEAETLAVEKRRSRVSAMLEELAKQMEPDLAKRGAVLELDEGLVALPRVSVDPARFAEAMRNLIENAAKFNHKPRRRVRVYGRAEGPEVVVSVEDEGPGIPPEEIPRMFQKFYQVEEQFTGQVEGAGLGLALVNRIVEAHGGVVKVTSVIGRGAIFSTSWPQEI